MKRLNAAAGTPFPDDFIRLRLSRLLPPTVRFLLASRLDMSLTEYGEFADTLMEGHNTHGDVGQPHDPSGGWPPSSQPAVLPTPPLQKYYDQSRGHPAVLPNTPQSANTTHICTANSPT
ncbi:hypothetical protein Pcinc_013357 [Petrolisthes cinctipes]|uniref:Uncharacterized protein n=1 Tax=Petrolisthes cinctipes TaxID=88211 RepID=A0AAE1G2T2_PETCI|nr:hypothetical protein Pcinc_013357 [Petrolisthes cinctipes]